MLRPKAETAIDKIEAVETVNDGGAGPVVVLCEHASDHVPQCIDLGLREQDKRSHAAWDPGARGVAVHLSRALNAPLVAGKVSRLIYDCNRPPEEASAMPERVEVIDVPGNRHLSDADKAARVKAIYRPFCEAADFAIRQQIERVSDTVLITVHTFTPVYFDQPRLVEIGILNDSDSRMADAMLDQAGALPHRRIERNAPYGPEDGVTHSLKLHGIANGVPNVMIELRNDLVQTPEAEVQMAEELLVMIRPALKALEVAHA